MTGSGLNHWFFAEQIPGVTREIELDCDEGTHAVRVLRAQPGTVIGLLDGHGTRARAEIVQITVPSRSAAVRCRILEREQIPEPCPKICLYVSPPRAKQMTLIVRQATELGVWSLCPVFCDRSVARPDGCPRRWQEEAVAAAKQSGNAHLPRLQPPVPFAEAIAATPVPGYVGSPPDTGDIVPLVRPPRSGKLSLWIGPEGGFSPTEETQLAAAGLQKLSLGRWTLRTETAATALLAWLTGETTS